MTTENLLKTRKIAHARRHVERASNRPEYFRFLGSIVLLTLVPLFDNISNMVKGHFDATFKSAHINH